MMSALFEVVSAGAYASLQDAGRIGYRRLGVPWAGVLDRALMRIANRLAGNDEGNPVIECFDGGQQFRALEAPLRLAVAGAAALEVAGTAGHGPLCGQRHSDGCHPCDHGDNDHANPHGQRRIPSWHSVVLAPGETLRITMIAPSRIAVIAIFGLTVAPVMGSASTYARAALGGWHGRALAAGDRLPAQSAPRIAERILPNPPTHDPAPIRVVWGPQDDHFTEATRQCLVSSVYRVGAAADRMGMRLEGAALVKHADHSDEIVSDATVTGTIQVPGNDQPIVLLADAQTVGGYPKIATVISADLPRLAARRPGDAVRFASVDAAQGEALARAHEVRIRALLDTIRSTATIDLDALYSANLVYGVVDALADTPAPPRMSLPAHKG